MTTADIARACMKPRDVCNSIRLRLETFQSHQDRTINCLMDERDEEKSAMQTQIDTLTVMILKES